MPGDDGEVEAMKAGEFREFCKRAKVANDNMEPESDEEATSGQVQGLKAKLDADIVPYADFGILRPYGGRLSRALKFQAKEWDPSHGTWVTKELSGPSSFKEWSRCWKVFNFIAKGLNFASVQKLDRYKEKIKQLDEKYGHVYGPDSTWTH